MSREAHHKPMTRSAVILARSLIMRGEAFRGAANLLFVVAISTANAQMGIAQNLRASVTQVLVHVSTLPGGTVFLSQSQMFCARRESIDRQHVAF